MNSRTELLCVRNLRTVDGRSTGIVIEKNETNGNSFTVRHIGSVSGERFGKNARVIDGEGGVLAPAFFDLHGFPDRHRTVSAWKSQTEAAARGGFGWIVELNPPSGEAAKRAWLARAAEGMSKALSVESIPRDPGLIADAKERGVLALSDGGVPISEHQALLDVMKAAGEADMLLLLSALSPGWQGILREGRAASYYKVRSVSDAAEELAVSRIVIFSRQSGCRVHIPCISTAGALRLIRAAKAEGLRITCGTTPFHLACSEDDLFLSGTFAKLQPPLTDRAQAEALAEGIADGTIDCISSGHTPCHRWEKQQSMEQAPFGAPSYRTFFGTCFSRLVERGVIDLPRLLELISTVPASLLGIDNSIAVGKEAAFAVLQPNREWMVGEDGTEDTVMTPLAGQTLRGMTAHSFICGKWY